ncbi:phosphonoacetate hydrolase [Mucilaginibacter oryzae]|uniref:Phosphonoacetate hydrolase n=2 Tax=Mucilaginibacter oryzae TaxID=468058 RepID=A0A316HIM3_9SPHI|nr:phosphonoacetate hydrolase [Mucilaginibacter oryzae]
MSITMNTESPQVKACDLCKSVTELTPYSVLPGGFNNNEIAVCAACLSELAQTDKPDSRYWRFLAEAMWSEIPAVQVLSWRILSRLKDEDWAAGCLEILYLDDDLLAWAKAGVTEETEELTEVHRDSLGNELQNGDSVVLTRTLDVKGSSLNARMGTVVKNIRLVSDNTDQVEGKIEGQTIVILTRYLRRQKS